MVLWDAIPQPQLVSFLNISFGHLIVGNIKMCRGVAECFGDVDLNFKSVVKVFLRSLFFMCVSCDL